MRLIVLCAGRQSRWKGYKEKKYMLPVWGEPLLARTVRRFKEALPDLDIVVLLRPGAMHVPYARCAYAPPNQLDESYKLTSSERFWDDEHTICLFGDVFFTDMAIFKILTTTPDEVAWFGRAKPSDITGCRYEEIFGVSFTAQGGQQILQAADFVRGEFYAGNIKQTKAWEIHRHLADIPLVRTGLTKNLKKPLRGYVGPNFIEIDDLTEDFDTQEDYELWCAASGSQAFATTKE
jgi:hypothetical protein